LDVECKGSCTLLDQVTHVRFTTDILSVEATKADDLTRCFWRWAHAIIIIFAMLRVFFTIGEDGCVSSKPVAIACVRLGCLQTLFATSPLDFDEGLKTAPCHMMRKPGDV